MVVIIYPWENSYSNNFQSSLVQTNNSNGERLRQINVQLHNAIYNSKWSSTEEPLCKREREKKELGSNSDEVGILHLRVKLDKYYM